eukprot:scaffold8034_cov78-Phaeocystis_antarctica.AAC.1
MPTSAIRLRYLHGPQPCHSAPPPASHSIGPLPSPSSGSHTRSGTPVGRPTSPVRILASSHASITTSSDSDARACCGSHARGSVRQPRRQHVVATAASTATRAGSPSPPQRARSIWSTSAAAAAWYACAWPSPPSAGAAYICTRGTAVAPPERRRAAIVSYDAAYCQRHHLVRLFACQYRYAPYELYHLYAPCHHLTARLLHAAAPSRGELRDKVFVRVHIAPGARRQWSLRPPHDLRHEPVVGQPQFVARHVLLDTPFPARGEVGGLALAFDLDRQPADLGHHKAGVKGEL